MIHDPLCPEGLMQEPDLDYYLCECELIAKIRADERNEIKIRLEMIERLIGGAHIRLAINTIDKRGKDESTHYSRSGD